MTSQFYLDFKHRIVKTKMFCCLVSSTLDEVNSATKQAVSDTDNNNAHNNNHEIKSANVIETPKDTFKCRWSDRQRASNEVWSGRSADEMPCKKVSPGIVPDIFTSYSGPDRGLALFQDNETVEKDDEGNHIGTKKSAECAGAKRWNLKTRKAYGICMSLYDQHPVNGKISGDPIADAFGICARKNNALMIVADGVNWGEKSKLAARAAVYGCMRYINEQMFTAGKPPKNTWDAFFLLLKAFEIAHQTILEKEGGLTTLCAGLVLPLKGTKQYAVCIVNVGDSFAYVFSRHHGVREITTGSHDIEAERDIRDAGGALGPVDGQNPELHNQTCSMTIVDPGDIVFLTTDGISDNFDPVVTKLAVSMPRRHSSSDLTEEIENCTDSGIHDTDPGTRDGKPEMEPNERHWYAVKEMERIIHEFELFTEIPVSAQEMAGAILQHVLKLTDSKRKVLENPDLYGKKLRSKDRKRRDSEIISKMSLAPGKLDHATIVSYEVGNYHGNDDENYEAESEDEDTESNYSAEGSPKRKTSMVFESNV